ncbi:uncharacterized protein LOC113870201 [Abrus precatorius]|uniref:Uncharacterized protein LOC113870201 n=1 Tax=Abrus precatorius TaxID=3816 RepID=A0A8B8M623_ABRPR|nr:uncharacterized protein LOC113870201 [Abrus precatorius]
MASGSDKPLSYPETSTLLLLKDYLRDDLSSCSSSGFRSLPRRQCCFQPLSSSCSAQSTLRKASEAFLNAIKSVAISALQRSPSLTQTQWSTAKRGHRLSTSLSRRLLSRSFWRRSSKGGKTTTFKSTVNTNSCPESHFTCSLTNAEIEGSVTTTNTCSVTNSTRDWPNEEKEQFSPVSVLDCPLFDEDEVITSPFASISCSRQEVAKHKHMQKTRHFNRVASLKPVALEKKISWLELQKDESINNHPTEPRPVFVSITNTQSRNNNPLRDTVEENARDLLTLFKKSIPLVCLKIETETLLFDFFKQSIWENCGIENIMKRQLCEVAEDWIRGPKEQYLSFQVRKGRDTYIKEMDKCGSWTNSDEEIQCLAMELEVEFSISLVKELVLDLTTC